MATWAAPTTVVTTAAGAMAHAQEDMPEEEVRGVVHPSRAESGLGIAVSGHGTGEAARGIGQGDSATPCIGLGANARSKKRSAERSVIIKPFIINYEDNETATTAEASSVCSSEGDLEGESDGESDGKHGGLCTGEWSAQPPHHWGVEDPRVVVQEHELMAATNGSIDENSGQGG